VLRARGQTSLLHRDRADRKLRLSMTGGGADAVWREMRSSLRSFIARRVSDPRDAEDVLQEVMLRIHRHAERMDGFEHLDAWVHQVARSVVVDFYRRRAARPELPAGSGEDVATSWPSATADDAPSGELRSELAACLNPLLERLSHKHRQALEPTAFDGLSQVAAAAQLGLSNTGLKARVQRARGRLRELLLECCRIDLDRRGGIAGYQVRPGGCAGCDEAVVVR
jgi:RNA polymerase sigma-70 factor (ECF subfamily)